MNKIVGIEKKIKILFPEGSSLSARQALTALGNKGYIIDVCDPNPYCICRFSKYVRNIYNCPKVGLDPIGYYNFILQLLQKEKYDVLLPIHEQSFLFSKKKDAITEYVNIAISDFVSFGILQSKVSFIKLLQQLNISHPQSQFIKAKAELDNLTLYPYYIKLPYGTAGHGTWKVENKNKLNKVIKELETEGYLSGNSEILVQQAVLGTLSVVQALFITGELVGAHCYQLCSEGVGGSASARIGVNHPNVIGHVSEVGSKLKWHGCFMLDYIYNDQTKTPYYIEANPRLGETMNATLSGFNIAEMLTKLSLKELSNKSIKLQFGFKTNSLMATLLGIGSRGGSRKEIIFEIVKAVSKSGNYKNSEEELTPIKKDFYSIVPILFITLKLLVNPNSATQIAAKTIQNYSISESTVTKINGMTNVPNNFINN